MSIADALRRLGHVSLDERYHERFMTYYRKHFCQQDDGDREVATHVRHTLILVQQLAVIELI
jgi:hypothetical protein